MSILACGAKCIAFQVASTRVFGDWNFGLRTIARDMFLVHKKRVKTIQRLFQTDAVNDQALAGLPQAPG
jgi:glutamine phosphoribosylpyrophosphate amidotransferase